MILSKMKKISALFVTLAAVAGLSSCSETWDDNPTLNFHEGDKELNFLNEPEMKDMSVQITEENASETFLLTCSQPKEYGYAASVAYTLDVSIYPDFTAPEGVSTPAFVELPTVYRRCDNINPSRREIAEALCKMLDVKDANDLPTPYTKMYARLHANVVNENGKAVTTTKMEKNENGEDVEVTLGTAYTSNIVVMCENVSCAYLAIVVPGLPTGIYMRGGMNNWLNDAFDGGPDAGLLPNYEFLTTSEANTYELAYVEVDAGISFKFADKGWGEPNLGIGSAAVEYGIKTELGWNTGNITLPTAFKGSVTLSGKDKTWFATFFPLEPDTPGQPTGIYLRGDHNGWGEANEFLTTDAKGVMECPLVELKAGAAFKVADATWSDPNLGCGENAILTPGTSYNLTFGGGNIKIEEDFTGKAILRKKGNAYSLTLVAAGS